MTLIIPLKVRIDGTIWAGNIEMHVFSSDWRKHKHQHDSAYDNVILHVVYEDDKPVLDNGNIPIPTLELKGKIPKITNSEAETRAIFAL